MIFKMRRVVLSCLWTQIRFLVYVPPGGFKPPVERLPPKKKTARKKPISFRKKPPKTPQLPFKESPSTGRSETRVIRTKPMRRDFSEDKAQLEEAKKMIAEPQTTDRDESWYYDPTRKYRLSLKIDRECLPDNVELSDLCVRDIDKIDYSILPLDKNDQSRVGAFGW